MKEFYFKNPEPKIQELYLYKVIFTIYNFSLSLKIGTISIYYRYLYKSILQIETIYRYNEQLIKNI